MASPILQKLSPKSPLTFKQTLTKSLTIGFKKSPSTLAPPKTNLLRATPENLFVSPKFPNSVFICGRKSDDGTTPRPFLGPTCRVSPDSPLMAGNFSTTKACNALVQSPCRLDSYRIQRRRLYHQDSAEEYGGSSSIGSAPGSASSFQSTPKIGKGGFGSVFVGKYDGKIVAIKQLHSSQKDRIKGESLCSELNAFKLNHPNIVKILTFTCSGSVIQIVSEYVGKRNLQKLLDDNEEIINFDRRLKFCKEISSALCFCHENRVLHLDVKPTNILITDSTDVCKLADFGCSRCLPSDSDTLPLTPCVSAAAGTLIYKAPELLRGLPASTKCDVYSYGFVVWQIVTRQQLFENLNPHTVVFCVVAKNLRPPISIKNKEWSIGEKQLLEIAENCWHHNPNARPSFKIVCTKFEKL